ncbi:hypothetical protein P5U49_000213 [Neisseria gonorrhoeae]
MVRSPTRCQERCAVSNTCRILQWNPQIYRPRCHT